MESISDKPIIVDLDTNKITWGDNERMSHLLPSRRKTKLEETLVRNTEDIFLNARGLETYMEDEKSLLDKGQTQDSANRVWQEKLKTYDDAFNLAFTPNSESINEKRYAAHDCGQSRWDVVQEA